MSQAEEDAASETASESSVSTNFDEETDSYTHRDPSSRSTGTSGAGLTSNFPKKKARTSNPRRGFHIGNEHVQAKGKVSRTDGRLSLAVNEGANKGYVAKLLGAGLHRHLGTLGRAGKQHDQAQETLEIEHSLSQQLSKLDTKPPPALNIVIMVIGSRGDIQPFIRIGKILKEEHDHRVRIATHTAFKQFVEEDCGLEHFDIGGNPSELMAFMVKNPGLLPSYETVKQGEIGKRRKQMAEMFVNFWHACVEPTDKGSNDSDAPPFVADAIISNPPVMIHAHCAERLGCPLHIMFTFPYTPTQKFPHPLANLKAGNVDESYMNFMSYPLVEMMTWQGLGDLVNDTRENVLGLDPVSTVWAPGQLYRMRVPYTYLWSPSLVPKPPDWGSEVNIAGFVFLDLASSFKPPKDLEEFLEAGDPPIYIGFGSIVVDDAAKFTNLVFEAAQKAGVRALVNKGWGGIGDEGNTPDNIFMLDNVPHDWLFPRCKAVVHHGGAGTTAIGLKCGKPTVIVPFFGDQPFWGAMVASAKAGAHESIPYKQLTSDKLAEGIKQCLTEEAQANAQKIADNIASEGDGAKNAVDYFHKSLPLKGTNSLRGSVMEDTAASWRLKNSNLRLSPLAAEILVQNGKLSYDDLRLLRVYDWTDFQGAGAPITGASTAVFRTITGFSKGIAEGPVLVGEDVKKHARYERKKMRRKKEKDIQTREKSERIVHDRTSINSSASATNENTQTTEERDPSVVGQPERSDTNKSAVSGAPSEPLAAAIRRDAHRGISAPMRVIAKAPMEILLGLGEGFHNAPRLYGDETVRRPLRVTDLRSGLHAAGHEFAYESYDAVTGVFTQPVEGAKARGIAGFATGAGKGIGGLLLKGSAAVISPVGYALKGMHKELHKTETPVGRIRAARMAQGKLELGELTPEERTKAEEEANRGMEVMRRLWKEGEKMKREGRFGMRGRWRFRKEKKKWDEFGALESVEMSEKAMEARSKGIPFEEFMEEHRRRKQDAEQRTRGGAPIAEGDEKASWWGSKRPAMDE